MPALRSPLWPQGNPRLPQREEKSVLPLDLGRHHAPAYSLQDEPDRPSRQYARVETHGRCFLRRDRRV